MSIQPGANLYGIGIGSRPETVEVPFLANRAPTVNDVLYPVGKRWVQIGVAEYVLLSFTSSSSGLSANWEIVAGNSLFPITPYVVGPVGEAGFQTIQSALNAANAAGGGIVYVLPGVYTENLTLYGDTGIVGVPGNSDSGTGGNTTVIVGTHTPPLTGSFSIVNVRLNSATDVFASTAAGSSSIIVENAFIAITSGYLFNLPNWTGAFVTYNLGEGSTNNGMVNNTGGALSFFVSATHGAGTGKTMITSGLVEMQEVDLNCPWNATTGTIIACDYVIFTQTVTCSNNSTGAFNFCRFTTGTTPALTMSSSAAVSLNSSLINSSNNPAITGAGAGILTLSNITLQSNAGISGSLTISYSPTSLGPTFVNGNLSLPLAASGIILPVGTASGGTPQTLNARVGAVTFTGVSIAGGAVTTLVMNNSTITGAATVIHYAIVGVTTGAALNIQSVTNSAGHSSIVVANGTGLTTNSANLTFNFIVLN